MKAEKHELKKESQSSFEFGNTKNKHKVYYWDVPELEAKLKAIKELFDNNSWIPEMVENTINNK